MKIDQHLKNVNLDESSLTGSTLLNKLIYLLNDTFVSNLILLSCVLAFIVDPDEILEYGSFQTWQNIDYAFYGFVGIYGNSVSFMLVSFRRIDFKNNLKNS